MKFCSVASFKSFNYRCDEYAIVNGYIEQDINFQDEQTSSKNNRF